MKTICPESGKNICLGSSSILLSGVAIFYKVFKTILKVFLSQNNVKILPLSFKDPHLHSKGCLN